MNKPATTPRIRVTVWNENVHDRTSDRVRELYPDGMHGAIADALSKLLGDAVEVRTATLDAPDQGLPPEVLDATDVLLWWGHVAHGQVADGLAERVQRRVLDGMGLIVLHSGHLSKPFKRLMGTGCTLRWREADDREVLWCVSPGHPIAEGVPEAFVIPEHEMYGEFFDIPAPDELVFISNFSGGEVFRSGCLFHRGKGKVFYFSPGHETYPVFHHPVVQRVLANAVQFLHNPSPAPVVTDSCPEVPKEWFA